MTAGDTLLPEIGPRRTADATYWLRRFSRDQWGVSADGVIIYGPTADRAAARRELDALAPAKGAKVAP